MMTSPLFNGEINSCYLPVKINSELLSMGTNPNNDASPYGGRTIQWINETYPILVQPILQDGHCVPFVPCLKILREPQPIFRFRYGSELQTERHGFLLARSVDPHNKDWMSVQLENWYGQGDVWIRYSLVTDTPERSQHFHRLGKKTPDNQMIASEYYQYNAMTRKENNYWTAEFPGISILREKKSCVKQMIVDRQKANGILTCVNQEEIKMMWSMRDTVRIKFEAFSVVNGRLQDSICQPVYSEPIRHSKKSKKEDQLHIVKVCNAQGLCTGNEEICIFVKKLIKDDIGILFFQNVGQYQWRVEAEVTDVHHGLAIAFKTPTYYNQKIQESVTVQLVLFSKGLDYRVSKPKTFTYLPIIGESPIPAKVDCDMVQLQQLPELRSSQYTQKSDSRGNVIPNAPSDLNVLGQNIFDAGDVFEGLSFNDFHQIIDEYDDINSSKLLDEYTMILDDYYQTDAVKSNNTLEQTRQRNNKIESVRQQTQPIPADKKVIAPHKSVGVNWQSFSRGSASADIPVVEGLDIIINRLLINDDEASENDSSDSDDTSSDDDTDSESNSINNGSDYSSSDEN